MVDISICIVNSNSIGLLVPCLKSLRARTVGVTYEVIVVDNNSADGTVRTIRENFPWVTLVESKETLGYTPNMNNALRRAGGRYVGLLNDDTELVSDAFSQMVGFLDEHADYGATSPRLLNPDGTFQIGPRGPSTFWTLACWELKLYRLFPKSRLLSGFEMTYWDPTKPCDIQTMSGACIVVRRDVLGTVGLLDEHIVVGPDDCDISYRICAAGWRLHYAGDVAVIHHGGSSRLHPEAIVRSQVRMYTGWYWYLSKHFGWSRANAFRPIAITGALLRIGYWSLVFIFRPGDRQRARGELRGRVAIVALSMSLRLKAHVLHRPVT